MAIAKNIAWFILYIVAFIVASFSLVYFSDKDLTAAFIASLVSMSIYTILITRNLRFISAVSFFTLPVVSLLILGAAGKQTNGAFLGSSEEKAYMLATSLLMFALLVNSAFWARKQGFRKLVGMVCATLSVFMLLTFGTVSPSYYQNFVYTRINILILLVFGIFLIIKKKKLLGILGVASAIGTLFLSTAEFAEKTYTLEEKEQTAVMEFIDPKAKEMFGYYNQEDYANFCKYCGFVLNNMMSKNPIINNRAALGPYVYFGEPSTVIRKKGSFYVEYPVKFQNVENLMYVTFQMEDVSAEGSIYGFSLSDEQSQ